MKPLFYRCCCRNGLRGLCFFISLFYLIYVVGLAVAFLISPAFYDKWESVWTTFNPSTMWLGYFAFAVEVLLVPVWCITLFIGCFVRRRIFVLVTMWLQGIGLFLGAIHHLYCQWWHQECKEFKILLIYSLLLWLRTFSFFITHSYYDQLGRELVIVHPDYRRDSFVLPHLRPEYDRTQILFERGTGPPDEAEEHTDDPKKQQSKKKGASATKPNRRPISSISS